MPRPVVDSVAALRSTARRVLAGIRRDAADIGQPGGMTMDALLDDAEQTIRAEADQCLMPEVRRHFLAEMDGEARSEWMVQADPDGPRARFYDALRGRIKDLTDVPRRG